ncbi:acyclic terpene utilization AtuA family protein [Longispora sp. NPDC051575]|uniref:acyclic terpene utilization AtuA family protein n=1 Tax=Longispora sp. NPDC051575 TaxID=3154943 RepID=UPI0034271E3F
MTVLRIGNASGFYGDRHSAVREMLTGGDLDVLTGDYLAELTMLILGRDQLRDPSLGYARTFLGQMEECLGLAVDQGVRIVTNAGGLNPAGLAAALRTLAGTLGVTVSVAHVEGDDVRDGFPGALTANAYLGAWGIAEGLAAGADIVVTGRVTDASLVVGPAAAHFGWARDDWDVLAGATVAGHILECGTQATGGNYAFFTELPALRHPGFPIAEVRADGSALITKHPGTDGAVTVDTVRAQLLYEITGPRYAGPDVTTRFDTIALTADGPDRVLVSGVRGEPPPGTVKVAVTSVGGYRNEALFILTGLDVESKAALVRSQLELPEARWTLARTDHADADVQEEASALLRCVVRGPDPKRVGKAFSARVVELALGSVPGFHLAALPGEAVPYGDYRAEFLPASTVEQVLVLPDATRHLIAPIAPVVMVPATGRPGAGEVPGGPSGGSDQGVGAPPPPDMEPLAGVTPGEPGAPVELSRGVRGVPERAPSGIGGEGTTEGVHRTAEFGPTRRLPLGTLVGARSGDKGGAVTLGVWVRDPRAWPWLTATLTTHRLHELLPETAANSMTRHLLPNLNAALFVVDGLLGSGVAEGARFDPQGKAVGEWLRSRIVDIPEDLL